MARKSHAHTMINSRLVPKTPGPGVHAVRIDAPGASLFTGQLLPLERPSGAVSQGPLRKQADIVFAHLRQVVTESGFKLDQVVRLTLYVTSLKNLAIIDELYSKLFFTLAQPARTLVCVQGLPLDALIALDAIAIKPAEAQAPSAPPPDFEPQDDENM